MSLFAPLCCGEEVADSASLSAPILNQIPSSHFSKIGSFVSVCALATVFSGSVLLSPTLSNVVTSEIQLAPFTSAFLSFGDFPV